MRIEGSDRLECVYVTKVHPKVQSTRGLHAWSKVRLARVCLRIQSTEYNYSSTLLRKHD